MAKLAIHQKAPAFPDRAGRLQAAVEAVAETSAAGARGVVLLHRRSGVKSLPQQPPGPSSSFRSLRAGCKPWSSSFMRSLRLTPLPHKDSPFGQGLYAQVAVRLFSSWSAAVGGMGC